MKENKYDNKIILINTVVWNVQKKDLKAQESGMN